MPIVLEDHFNISDDKYSDFIRNHHASVLNQCEFHAGMGVVGPATRAQEWRWSVIHVTNDIGRSIEIVKSLESLWLYGYRRKENHPNNHWRLITDEEEGFSGLPGERKSLNFDGKYPGYTAQLNVSRLALNSAITTLDNYAQELDNGTSNVNYNQAKRAFVVLILYFAEALRIIPIRDVLIEGFDKSQETVIVGDEYMELAKRWSINSHSFLSSQNLGQGLWLALRKKGTQLCQLDGIPPGELEDPNHGVSRIILTFVLILVYVLYNRGNSFVSLWFDFMES